MCSKFDHRQPRERQRVHEQHTGLRATTTGNQFAKASPSILFKRDEPRFSLGRLFGSPFGCPLFEHSFCGTQVVST
ncbi:hypothetical protein D3C83_138730 [compost metagenome]